MMEQLIRDFSNHLKQAIEIGEKTNFRVPNQEIKNVLVCGLGGSGIGGTISSQLLQKECKVPILVNKGYHIPAYINQNSLVVCCSYSGNTEETLSMYEQAKKQGAEIAVITSGGNFAQMAAENSLNIIQIPGGLPPRAAFGLSFPQLFFVFHKYQIIDGEFITQLNDSIKLIDQEEKNIQQEAKTISEKLFGKLPVIYSETFLEGVAIRFRQQINENAKMLCWHHKIPEMNHNELVGWRTANKDLAVVLFRSDKDFYRNQKRMDFCKDVFEKYADSVTEIHAKGKGELTAALYLIHLGDWVSLHLAQKKEIDAVEVDVITGLKDLLANLN